VLRYGSSAAGACHPEDEVHVVLGVPCLCWLAGLGWLLVCQSTIWFWDCHVSLVHSISHPPSDMCLVCSSR